MARIRTIKPEFWSNEDLASVSETARLVAIGLLNIADDEGYFNANPKLIESALFPLTEPSVSLHGALTELSNIGYIELFDVDSGKQYGVVAKFTEHQRINRPTPSKIKHLRKFTEDSVSAHGGLSAGKERKGKERKGNNSSRCDSLFEDFWKSVSGWNGNRGNKQEALNEWKKLNPDEELIKTMLDWYTEASKRVTVSRRAGEFVPNFKHVCRWLKGRGWEDDLPGKAEAVDIRKICDGRMREVRWSDGPKQGEIKGWYLDGEFMPYDAGGAA